MLNKKEYCEANKSYLGVKLRQFQQWFHSQASDMETIKAKTKPKPELVRKQNKVEFQADRTRYTPQNKLDLIRHFDRQKMVNPGLTQKEFCSVANSIQKLATILLALNKPIILFKFANIKMQVSSRNFLSFFYCIIKKDVPTAEFFSEISKRQRNL